MTAHLKHAPGMTPTWWTTPGPALCPWCEQPHQIEAMLYCSACDGIVCAVCVIVRIDYDPRCPVCHDSSRDV